MTEQPMSSHDMHNAIVDLRAQLYAAEIMIARLYLGLASTQPNQIAFLDEAKDACLGDAARMRLEHPYGPEAAANMRQKITTRIEESFAAMTPKPRSPREGGGIV